MIYLPTLLSVAGFVSGGFILSRILKRNDIADGMWGLGFIAVALSEVAFASGPTLLRTKVVTAMVLIWGLRLSLYLWTRLFGKSEDARYANWRSRWGASEPWRAFLQVFLLQGILLGLISMPIGIIAQAPAVSLSGWCFLGLSLFIGGLVIEVVADAQMVQFKREPTNLGRPLTSGFWGHCRHPNYLGEILIWWGIFLMGVDLPGGMIGIISPLILTFLLTRVSGVPMLDKLLKKRGQPFEEYVRTVPALIPVRWNVVLRFFALVLSLVVLDAIWLGGIMKPFYLDQTAQVARIRDGGWDVVGWAAVQVYLFLALGLFLFSLQGAANRLEAGFRGALLGLVIYGVYETTNIALVRDWPLEMALVDIAWGAVLCGTTAYVVGPSRDRA